MPQLVNSYTKNDIKFGYEIQQTELALFFLELDLEVKKPSHARPSGVRKTGPGHHFESTLTRNIMMKIVI